MKTIFVSPLKSDHYYHIFNQGNNQEDIYKEGKNYIYFLEKYKELIAPIAKTYAFCLLSNHFHIFLKIKSYTGLSNALPVKFPRPPKILNGNSLNKEKLNDFDNIISKKLSRRFAGFFAGYARAINNGYGRSGKLFSLPFKRI